jgi:hypothetical protein
MTSERNGCTMAVQLSTDVPAVGGTSRRATRALGAVGAGIALLAAVSAFAPAAGATTKSTNNLVDDALYDALTSGFVHEVSTFSGSGQSLKMVNDIGSNEGQQTMASGAAFGQVLVIGHQTFVRGNTQALQKFFGTSQATGTADADQWVVVPSSNRHYADITAAVTLKSDFNQLPIPNALKAGSPVERDGHKVIPVTGTIAATKHDTALHMTLYITDSKNNPMPIGMTYTVDHTTQTVTWSDWGETPTLNVPTTTLSLSGTSAANSNSATVTAV